MNIELMTGDNWNMVHLTSEQLSLHLGEVERWGCSALVGVGRSSTPFLWSLFLGAVLSARSSPVRMVVAACRALFFFIH
ncbi:hypothetical protein OF83DRAFT_1123498 [Amylostereum chailletii]|nr:hypothetical protein OF83DRAFT_1123498 [Amylostereum chailletii]